MAENTQNYLEDVKNIIFLSLASQIQGLIMVFIMAEKNEMLKKLPRRKLLFILACQTYQELEEKFSEETLAKWQKAIQQPSKKAKTTPAVYNALTGHATYPLLILWTLLGLASFAFWPLAFAALAVLSMTVGIGIYHFISEYKEQKQAEKEWDKLFFLYHLQQQAADELLERAGNTQLANVLEESAKDKIAYHKRFNQAINAGFLVGLTMFATYYICTTAIVTAFAASSSGVLAATLTAACAAMAGPIGLGVAGCIIAGLAIYMGYKYYQANKHEDELVRKQEQMTSTLMKKKRLYVDTTEQKKPHKKVLLPSARHAGKRLKLQIASRFSHNPYILLAKKARYKTQACQPAARLAKLF